MNHTDPTAETARALLYRHGLPEDVIDGALCLHAQELGAMQREFAEQEDAHLRTTSATVYVQGIRDAANRIDPTKTEAAAFVVASPPPDRAAGGSGRAAEAELYVLLRKAGEDRHEAQALIDRHRDEVLRRLAAEAPQPTPCGPAPDQCDAEAGEPCANHEREQAHAEGEHCFCGPECTEAPQPDTEALTVQENDVDPVYDPRAWETYRRDAGCGCTAPAPVDCKIPHGTGAWLCPCHRLSGPRWKDSDPRGTFLRSEDEAIRRHFTQPNRCVSAHAGIFHCERPTGHPGGHRMGRTFWGRRPEDDA